MLYCPACEQFVEKPDMLVEQDGGFADACPFCGNCQLKNLASLADTYDDE